LPVVAILAVYATGMEMERNMSLKVKVSDVIAIDPVIGRWSSLKIRPAMSMTLALVVKAILPVIENYRKLVGECQKEYEAFRATVVPPVKEGEQQPKLSDETMSLLADKFHELAEKPLKELLDTEVELDGIGKIKLSKLRRGRILPRVHELVAASLLVEGDLEEDDFDYENDDEAEPI
jgi:hypothetical protein